MHLTFHMLMTGQRKQSGLPLLLIAYNWLKERGLLDVWRCVAAQLVLRFGEGNPDHFDAQTGELVYQQVRGRAQLQGWPSQHRASSLAPHPSPPSPPLKTKNKKNPALLP